MKQQVYSFFLTYSLSPDNVELAAPAGCIRVVSYFGLMVFTSSCIAVSFVFLFLAVFLSRLNIFVSVSYASNFLFENNNSGYIMVT